MNQKNILRLLIILFLFLFSSFLIISNLNKPRILILHSYDTDYSWVTDIDKSIQRTFVPYSFSIRYFYMDTKRHPEQYFILKSANNAIKIIENWLPDIIIAVDDNAQQYVAQKYINHPTIKIIFTGVNADHRKYNYHNAQNVTGILERIPFPSFKKVFLQILPPNQKKFIHVSDNSNTSKAIFEELESVDWKPFQLVDSIKTNSFQTWKKTILNAPKIADIILFTHYHTIKNDSSKNTKTIPPKKIMEWTKKYSKLPGIGCWGFFVTDGGMVAISVSPFEQGELAAKLAIKIIEKNIKPKDIPPITGKLYLFYVNNTSIKKYNIFLPTIYESFARATQTFFE